MCDVPESECVCICMWAQVIFGMQCLRPIEMIVADSEWSKHGEMIVADSEWSKHGEMIVADSEWSEHGEMIVAECSTCMHVCVHIQPCKCPHKH
jgi:hypothetical protein